MTFLRLPHRLSLRTQFLLSGVLFFLCVFLLLWQIRTVRQMRDVGLPAAMELRGITRRMSILKEQSDIAELQASLTGGTNEEMLRMYVLPGSKSIDRLLATIDLVTNSLQSRRHLESLSAVHIEEGSGATLSGTGSDALTATPVSFSATVDDEGLRTLLLFLDTSGFLTIGDALTHEQQSMLLKLTEDENPAAVTSLEAFLGTDLLAYTRDQDTYEGQLLKSFSSETFSSALRSMIRDSSLMSAREFLQSPLGRELEAQKLWPLRFVTSRSTALERLPSGRYRITVRCFAYGR